MEQSRLLGKPGLRGKSSGLIVTTVQAAPWPDVANPKDGFIDSLGQFDLGEEVERKLVQVALFAAARDRGDSAGNNIFYLTWALPDLDKAHEGKRFPAYPKLCQLLLENPVAWDCHAKELVSSFSDPKGPDETKPEKFLQKVFQEFAQNDLHRQDSYELSKFFAKLVSIKQGELALKLLTEIKGHDPYVHEIARSVFERLSENPSSNPTGLLERVAELYEARGKPDHMRDPRIREFLERIRPSAKSGHFAK